MSEKICRLCLQTVSGNYQTIDQSLKNTLKLSMDVSKEAVKCRECINNLEVFFKFKSACDYIKSRTLPIDLKDDIDLDPENIEFTNNLISFLESDTEIRCCFCTKASGREAFTSLNESKEHKFLMDVLKEHIPKLTLNITEDLLTCDTCLDGLQVVLKFIMKCLDVDQKISKYTELKGTNGRGQIELKDVQQFIFEQKAKFEVESNDVNELREGCDQFQGEYIMQAEAARKHENGIENPDLFIKMEEIDIKSEEDNCESAQGPTTVTKVDNGSLGISVLASQESHKKCLSQQELTNKYSVIRKNQHKLIHKSISEVKKFKCNVCKFEAKRKESLARHILVHKSPLELTMFKCELCPYEAKLQYQLKRHTLIHKCTSELTMFQCYLCPYKAKRRTHLKRHELIHKSFSDITTFKCELCPYETKRTDHLKLHQLTHKNTSELTLFKCDLCPFQAKRKTHITSHKFIHKSTSDITMFKCELCPYKAKQKRYLKQHKLTHACTSELAMFKCNLCPYQTKRKYSVKLHKLSHKTPL